MKTRIESVMKFAEPLHDIGFLLRHHDGRLRDHNDHEDGDDGEDDRGHRHVRLPCMRLDADT
jgi:hypothetical protein